MHELLAALFKLGGNSIFPIQKNGSRGAVGDYLASKTYEPPPINPSAEPVYQPKPGLLNVLDFTPQTAQINPQMPGINGNQGEVQGAQTQDYKNLLETLRRGFERYGSPLAQNADVFAQAAQQIPWDPYLPAEVALSETSGGKNITRGEKNIFNVNANTGGVNYPDIKTAVLGGWNPLENMQSQGFMGNLLHSSYYQDYLKSHNLVDFLRHHSPAEDNNGTYDEQLKKYALLSKYFE